MANNLEEEQERTPSSDMLFLRVMSKRRIWVCIFVLVYAIILTSSWNFLKSILFWYNLQSKSSSSTSGWLAFYTFVLLRAVFGVVSMVAALAVMMPATLVTWIAIVVLLAFFGMSRKENKQKD
ncbi:hypothetical protein L484_017389 [Morus notabilis]|uniref:Uncharacterized protein n=1 Tax=Morus notabilis TaxID=981085 RepID=W9RD46_9ROSA|nr:uncharacterized protein LOC21400392 [Morus notabilis]EXB69111.1 hypothetical protein L484_017389 [Morus notabilis]